METRKIILFFFLVSIGLNGVAQENLGIRLSNYAPTQSIYLNPSNIVDSKAFIDIHLAGVSVFARNNYVYMSADSFSMRQVFRAPNTIGMPSFNEDRDQYRAYVNAFIQGPSISVTAGNHSFAITTGARAMADVRGLSSTVTDYIQEGFQNEQFYGRETRLSNFRTTSMTWAEFGFAYGAILKKRGNQMITGGVHIKHFVAGGGVGLRLNDWTFSVADSSRMVTHDIEGRYGLVEPAWKSGNGWGIDIGFTIKETLQDVTGYSPHQKRTGCKTCDYRYKVSMALIDVGRVKFKPPYWTDRFMNDSEYQWEDYTEDSPEDAEDVGALVADEFGASSTPTSNLRIWLPGALSTQIDYRVANHVYMNASLIAGIPWRKTLGIQRAAVLGLTPRFEWKRFEFSIPLTLHEAREPLLGAMIRLNGNLIIGTDHVGTYLFQRDRYGADVYVHFKHTIFKNSSCKEKGGEGFSSLKRRLRLRRVKKKKGPPPCAKW